MDTNELVFKKWSDAVPKFTYDPHQPFNEIFVPTVNTEMIKYVGGMLLNAKKPIMLTGDAGQGKSAMAGQVKKLIIKFFHKSLTNTNSYSVQTIFLRF